MILAPGDRDPGYLTHREIDAALELFPPSAEAHWVATEESDPDATALVVTRLACTLYGEVRTVTPVPGTRFAEICGTEPLLPEHPFFIATAFQPQVGASTTGQLGCVLEAFIAAASAK